MLHANETVLSRSNESSEYFLRNSEIVRELANFRHGADEAGR